MRVKSRFVVAVFLALFSFNAFAEQSPRVIVHLLDYLSQDYGGAVANGKVIDKEEYEEQVEFSQSAIDTAKALPALQNQREIIDRLTALRKLVDHKGPTSEVAKLAQGIKTDVIRITGLEMAPASWPDLNHGRELFRQNCVTCHGEKGDGNGPAAAALDPKPTSFQDPERMAQLSPFQAFNTIRVGLPGTAMAAFPAFTDKDVWALAFYLVSLRHQGALPPKNFAEVENLIDEKMLKQAAAQSDGQLEVSLPGKPDEKLKTLAALRLHSGKEDFKNTLSIAREYLKGAAEEYAAGRVDVARQKALLAYLEGVEPVEPRLKSADSNATQEVEALMAQVRQAIEGGRPAAEVKAMVDQAQLGLDKADALLAKAAPSGSVVFLIASAIILREGFEAVLLLIALLGVIRATGAQQAARYVHGGWVLALALGVVAWIFSGWLMQISGADRELMEGAIALFAVVVLLYMGFWLHSKTEIGRWKAFIEDRVQAAVDKSNLWALGFLSFIAVFREVFETVLFLRALWLEAGEQSKVALATGVFGSLITIFILSWALIRYAARIPIRSLFDYSSILMAVLAFILAGKGIHALQETGMISVTSLPVNLRIDILGFYPTLETATTQVVVLGLSMALWLYGKRSSPPMVKEA